MPSEGDAIEHAVIYANAQEGESISRSLARKYKKATHAYWTQSSNATLRYAPASLSRFLVNSAAS